jgi:hypothetical protein
MRFYMTITREEFKLLSELAWQERRVPREQAAVLLAEALRRRGQRLTRQQEEQPSREELYAAAR